MNYCCDCIYYLVDYRYLTSDEEVDEFWNNSSKGYCKLGAKVTGRDECFGKEDACKFFKEKRKENKNDNI